MMLPTLLSRKLMQIGSAILVVALVSIGLTLWVTWQLEGGAAAVNAAGRLRMQSWQLTSASIAGAPKAEVDALVAELDRSLLLIKSGDPSRPLFVPWRDASAAQFSLVEDLWRRQRLEALSQEAPAIALMQRNTRELVGAIDGFVDSIEQTLTRLTAILNLFQVAMMGLAISSAVVMMFTGYFYVLHPLSKLRDGLRKIESGDFGARVQVDSQDEFGQVANGFNGMAKRLQSMYLGLEAQVEAKTRHIEAQRARIETLYDVSAFLAGADSIEVLSKGFSQRVREAMKADAVAVRWSDEANQRYLMLASDCLPQDMADDERSLLAGACACGNLKPDARTRVIPIQNHDQAPVRHCAKVGYQTLVSVPIRLQDRLIGEIDLFFRSKENLRPDEVELLDALASHLASALEGLRAAALEREAAASEERALLARELHDSIAQSLAFLKIQVQLLRTATQRERPDQMKTALDELDIGLQESVNDVRELLVHFRTRTNTDDIEAALQETLLKFKQQTGLHSSLHVHGQGLPLPSDVQVQVLHVVQEALSNIRKHAKAQQVGVQVFKGAQWKFVIEDDGVGFLHTDYDQSTHVGLSIMRERAERIGAKVQVNSTPTEGTTVSLLLPTHPNMKAVAS